MSGSWRLQGHDERRAQRRQQPATRDLTGAPGQRQRRTRQLNVESHDGGSTATSGTPGDTDASHRRQPAPRGAADGHPARSAQPCAAHVPHRRGSRMPRVLSGSTRSSREAAATPRPRRPRAGSPSHHTAASSGTTAGPGGRSGSPAVRLAPTSRASPRGTTDAASSWPRAAAGRVPARALFRGSRSTPRPGSRHPTSPTSPWCPRRWTRWR